jgi:hypothetical protein
MKRKKPEDAVQGGLKKPPTDTKSINAAFDIRVFNQIKEEADEFGVQPAVIVRMIIYKHYGFK